MSRSSIVRRVVIRACVAVVAAVVLALVLVEWMPPWLAGVIAGGTMAIAATALVLGPLSPMQSMFRALAGTATSYRDGDYGFSLAWPRDDELGDLVDAHNELGDVLRQQRENLVQRELLLDTIVQNTPVAMVVTDPAKRIVYGNLAARKMMGDGKRLEGHALAQLMLGAPAALKEAIETGRDGLFVVEAAWFAPEGRIEDEVFHLARKEIRLNGRAHELLMLRHLTVERRAEVQTWKKVIRVISHELNNSLAPVASLAHSGQELVRRGVTGERLEKVLATIEERARHLEAFILGYAAFAKMPSPRLEDVSWQVLVDRLADQIDFMIEGEIPEGTGELDPAQIEQALVNLILNAHESGSAPEEVILRVTPGRFEVLDRGSGMTEKVLEHALLPFYSTKRKGTGLGLALVREIAEAHGGRVSLANREGGGLCVTLTLTSASR